MGLFRRSFCAIYKKGSRLVGNEFSSKHLEPFEPPFFFHQTSTNAPNVRCMGKFSLFSCVKGDVYELKYYVFTISVANPIFFFLKPIKLWVYTIFVLIFIH